MSRRKISTTMLLASLCVGAALACSSGSEEQRGGYPAASARFVQDLWLFERLVSVDEEGQVVDLAAALDASLEGEPALSVELQGGATFHAYDELGGAVLDSLGQTRGDVHVTVGFIQSEEGRALAALGTPLRGASWPIRRADQLAIDLGPLGDLVVPDDPVIADYGFLQGIPHSGDPSAGSVHPLRLLASRARASSVQYPGEEVDGELVVQIFSSELGSASEPFTTGADVAALSSALSSGERGGSTVRSSAAKLPAKAKPMTDGMRKGLRRCDLGVRCVSKFFRSFGDGAKTSFDLALCNDQLKSCEPDRPSPPAPPGGSMGGAGGWDHDWYGCDGSCGGVYGDPHLVSLDGADFSFQFVGEFVGARSDELEVQIRASPFREDRTISIVTATAIQVGGQRFVVSTGGKGLITSLDGRRLLEADFDDELEVGGASLLRRGSTFRLETPEGHVVKIFARSIAMDVWVEPAPSSAGTWEGILGDFDGDRSNDQRSRDGSPLPFSVELEDLRGFADEWRVSDEESLFDYESGEDTETFTDRSFPDIPISIGSLPADVRHRAETVCREAGISQGRALDACILDFAITGDISMIASAQATASVADGPSGSPDPGGDGSFPHPSWVSHAESLRGRDGEQFTFECSPEGQPMPVWGTDIYTDDSSVCTAAVHAGKIGFADGGEVTIEIRPIESSYTGSTRNGVTSRDRGRYRGSFVFP